MLFCIARRKIRFLVNLIGLALYSQHSLADNLASQCMLGIPSYDRPLVQGKNTNELPVTIEADKAKGSYPDYVVFNGNVDIHQGNSRLQSNEIELHQITPNGQSLPIRTVDALGNVHYDDNQVLLKGLKAWSNLDSKDTNVWQGNYQMVGRQGRGEADQIKLRGDNRYTILKNGTFTSCLPGKNSWSVAGSKIIHDREEQVAEIWNAHFKLGPVPMFYSPYMQIPVGNKRRSGFLIPNAKYGNNTGFEFILPYYWNIAPQADVTLIPHYISHRGMQWRNEFRYLTSIGLGLMEFDYLGSDRMYKDKHTDKHANRWLFYWNHYGIYDQHWRFNADYTKASDTDYFSDLDSTYGSTTDGYRGQKFSLGYADANWDAMLSTKQFQIFSMNTDNDVYRAVPQLDLNFYQNDVGPFDLHLYAQAVNFSNVNNHYPHATRLHLEPTIDLPLSKKWGSLNTEAKLLVTHYDQDSIDYYNSLLQNSNNQLRNSVSRVMPQFKVDGKIVFDRDLDYWSSGYIQTMEPHVQFLYTPYRDQSNIKAYDSTLLQTDYTGLFRDRTYSGLDRIASTNALTTGVTTRIFDNDLVERFSASIGQIYSFVPSKIGLNSVDNPDRGSLVWAGDGYWRINHRWMARSGLQYDTKLNDLSQGNAVLEYHGDIDRIVQLNYRYTSKAYVQQALTDHSNSLWQQQISQVGTIASWPIVDTWSLVGAWYYDTKVDRPSDQLLGVQYSSCCYAIRFGYERKINGWENDSSKYDNKISFSIELRGLSPNYDLGTGQMLRQGILPYQSVF